MVTSSPFTAPEDMQRLGVDFHKFSGKEIYIPFLSNNNCEKEQCNYLLHHQSRQQLSKGGNMSIL